MKYLKAFVVQFLLRLAFIWFLVVSRSFLASLFFLVTPSMLFSLFILLEDCESADFVRLTLDCCSRLVLRTMLAFFASTLVFAVLTLLSVRTLDSVSCGLTGAERFKTPVDLVFTFGTTGFSLTILSRKKN